MQTKDERTDEEVLVLREALEALRGIIDLLDARVRNLDQERKPPEPERPPR